MNLSPLPVQKFFGNDGRPLNGGLLFTYVAGTTTKVTTYKDSTGGPVNTNPIVLDYRGEANIWLDQTLTYKFVLSPANDTDPPTNPIWTVDNISAGITFASLTQQIIGLLLYPRTAAEISAGKTPTNYKYPESVVDRYGTNTTPGTTDMTQAIKDAVAVHAAGGAPVQFLSDGYVITDTCITITNSMSGFVVRCSPYGSYVINKASASKPSYKLQGAQDFDLQLPVAVGQATFPNIGCELVKDGSANRCGNGKLRDLLFLTNGGGLHIQDTNNLDIYGIDYWPSSFNPYGATIDTNGQPYALLADGTGAVNAVTVLGGNVSGLNTIANGGCGFKLDGSSSAAAFQNWRLTGIRCEGGTATTFRSLWLRNVAESEVSNYFAENAEVRLDDSCNTIQLTIAAAATGAIVVDGTQSLGACSNLFFNSCNASGITADSANIDALHLNCQWTGAIGDADSSTRLTRWRGRTTGSVLETDQMGGAGVSGSVPGLQMLSAFAEKRISVTYSGAMTVSAQLGNLFDINVTDNRVMTVGITNPPATGSQLIRIRIRNTSAGAIGAFTFTAVKMNAFTSPATGKNRVVVLEWDPTLSLWFEVYQSTADITN